MYSIAIKLLQGDIKMELVIIAIIVVVLVVLVLGLLMLKSKKTMLQQA